MAPGTAVVTDLQPYSQYSVRVGACTLFGCTTSPGVLVTTLQSRKSVGAVLREDVRGEAMGCGGGAMGCEGWAMLSAMGCGGAVLWDVGAVLWDVWGQCYGMCGGCAAVLWDVGAVLWDVGAVLWPFAYSPAFLLPAPDGIATPIVTVTGSTSVVVTWSKSA